MIADNDFLKAKAAAEARRRDPEHLRQQAALAEEALRKADADAVGDGDFGPPPDSYVEGIAEPEPEQRNAHKLRVVKPGDSRESRWNLPAESSPYRIHSPTAKVPDPESWLVPTGQIDEPPEVLKANTSEMNDVTSHAIAERLLRQLDEFFESVVFDGGRFHVYQNGVYRELPDDWWIQSCLQQYHGALSVQQRLGISKDSMPWFATKTNLASAIGSLRIFLLARQKLPTGHSYFSDASAFAVFENGTIAFDAATRTVGLAENSPSHKARFRYPFAYEPGLEPKHLLRVAREDMFFGVDREEGERRIQRLREQCGAALLGCQRTLNLHNVLVMLGAGHDGKSTWIELLKACMPPGSHLTMSPQDLSTGTGDGAEGRARLHGKFAVFCDDVSTKAMVDSSHYKTATAYGALSGRFYGSGVQSFEVDVRATWLLSCQALWKTPDVHQRGFQRRHCIVEFPNSIKDEEADKQLRRKLLAHEQREFICWAIEAAIELLESGRDFTKPECSDRLMRAWAMGDDAVTSFIEGNTEDCSSEPVKSWPPTASLHEPFSEWHAHLFGRHAKPVSLIEFARRLKHVRGVQVEVLNKKPRVSRRLKPGGDQ